MFVMRSCHFLEEALIPPALSSASLGIHRHLAAFNAAAHRIATGPIQVESIGDIVEMKQAKLGISINVAVMRMAHEMSGELVDILA